MIEFALFKTLEAATSETNNKVELFSTQFFTKLVSAPAKYTHSRLKMTEAKRKHNNVYRWTKEINIFKHKKILLYPINEEDLHWYLIMVVIPDVLNDFNPYVAVLDSMGDRKDSAVEEIRNYLIEELKSKEITTISPKAFVEMKTVYPKIPRQPDGSSCGLYLIHFVKQIVKGLEEKSLSSIFMDTSTWFKADTLNEMRFEISSLIKDTAENN